MKFQINLQNQNAINIYNDNQAQVKIVAKRQYILDDDVVITADNIKKIGELIALLTIRTVMCRSGKNLYRLYDGLIKDCNKSNERMQLTQGEYNVLCAYMSGLTYLEVTRLLNVNRTTIWRRRMKLQRKFNTL